MTRILIVTAVEAERAAVLRGLGRNPDEPAYKATGETARTGGGNASGEAAGTAASDAVGDAPKTSGDVDVIVGGVGPAAAAATTAVRLAAERAHGRPYHMVVSMGIGGAFSGRAAIGDVVVGTASIAADLGAQSPDGFLSVAELGFGRVAIDADYELVEELVKAGASSGSIITVCTVTGSAERAVELAEAHPDAVVEAMEGYGVACAAEATGVRFVEVRTISNLVGPRDRAAWRIGDALTALSAVAETVGTLGG